MAFSTLHFERRNAMLKIFQNVVHITQVGGQGQGVSGFMGAVTS